MEKFLDMPEERATTAIARSMEKIQKGQAISNIEEFEKAKLFTIKQY